MRRTLFLGPAIFLSLGLTSWAQSTCSEARQKYDQNAIFMPVRITTDISVKVREEDSFHPYSHFDEERIYPDRWHLKSTRSDSPRSYENLRIGEKNYYRENESAWTVKDHKPLNDRPDILIGISLANCTVAGSETLNGRTFLVLQWFDGAIPVEGREGKERGGWNKTWFYEDGRVLKKESYHFEPENGPNRYIRSVALYSYGDQFMIEPPPIITN